MACTTPTNPCSAIIRESGAMELTALANGAEQVDSASVTVNGAQVKIVPDSSTMKFSVFVPPAPDYTPRNDPNRQILTVSVVRTDGTPIPNRVVALALVAAENTAGHLHSENPPKPAGFLNGAATAQVNTGPTGIIHTVTFEAPEPSGPVTINGTSTGATPGSATVNVGLFTLSPYGPGTGYTLIGGDTHGGKHPGNHYATASHISALQRLAGSYNVRFHSGLQYNDASLQFGGLFDYAWETTPWNLPHAGHREGMHTDLRIYADMVNHLPDLSGAQLRHVKKYWKDALGGTIHLETDHWHLVHP